MLYHNGLFWIVFHGDGANGWMGAMAVMILSNARCDRYRFFGDAASLSTLSKSTEFSQDEFE